jgi:hypothetical protein
VAKLYAAFHDLAAGPTREIHSTDEISFRPLPLAGVRAAVRRSLRHGACVPPNNLFDDHLRTTGWELEMPVPEPDVMDGQAPAKFDFTTSEKNRALLLLLLVLAHLWTVGRKSWSGTETGGARAREETAAYHHAKRNAVQPNAPINTN